VTIKPEDIGVVTCGAKVGQHGKVCYERCLEGKAGCSIKSHAVGTNRIGSAQESIFILGNSVGLGSRAYVHSTPTLVLILVTPSILETLLPQTLGYDEWVPLLQLLNEKRLSLSEFESLGMRALDIKR